MEQKPECHHTLDIKTGNQGLKESRQRTYWRKKRPGKFFTEKICTCMMTFYRPGRYTCERSQKVVRRRYADHLKSIKRAEGYTIFLTLMKIRP